MGSVAALTTARNGNDSRALVYSSSVVPTPLSAPLRSTRIRYAAWSMQLIRANVYLRLKQRDS